jgi:hypothetical protein
LKEELANPESEEEGKRVWSKLFLNTRDSSNSVLYFQPAVYKILGLKQTIIIISKKKS